MSAQILPMSKTWGATKEEWLHLDILLGLTADLLPVVSNPNAKISPESKMKEKGKTPSHYNRNRMVAGLPAWTSIIAEGTDIEKWSADSDYGICIQTRFVRAIDVDCTDAHVAERIRNRIIEILGFCPPVRRRSNSSKFLMPVCVAGEFGKRKVGVVGGAIELLATGQQFIAVGTHPSGVAYDWEGGLPDEIPEIDMPTLESVWDALVAEFAIDEPTESRASKAVVRQPGELPDPVADYMDANGWVHDVAADGRVFIRCPFEDEHTSESNGTDTTYFTRGTGGYDQGHFKCLHGHCTGRSDNEFLVGIGYFDAAIPELPAQLDGNGVQMQDRPSYERDKNGRIESTRRNIEMAIRRPDECGVSVAFDEFYCDIMLSENLGESWRPMNNTDTYNIVKQLERIGFKRVSLEDVGKELESAAEQNRIDYAKQWINSLVWDGVPRIDTMLHRYMGVQHGAYATAISQYTMTAIASRILFAKDVQKTKADIMPIAFGDQGDGKSTVLLRLMPHSDFACVVNLSNRDSDLLRRMNGKLICEVAELRGFQSRDSEDLKAFITEQFDDVRPLFAQRFVRHYRRSIFFGTTNIKYFLTDPTGNRRFAPFKAGKCDPDGIELVRDQLWAEARELAIANGVMWQECERLALIEHNKYTKQDAWQGTVEAYLNTPNMDGIKPGDGFVTSESILMGALYFSTKDCDDRALRRVGCILSAIGYKHANPRINGHKTRGWVKENPQNDLNS